VACRRSAQDAGKDDQTMRAAIVLPLVVLASGGCANQQLRYSTARQISTHGDLQLEQVISLRAPALR
jgi:hypothetical protein